jgi:predicted nucleic acid-binding protein
VGSEVLEYEIAQTPDPERRGRVLLLAAAAQVTVALGPAEEERGGHLEALGFRPFDALHVACAEGGGAAVLLTTDDRFLRAARRSATLLRTRVENPLTWLQEAGKP